jgi:hypothetical protein
VPFGQFTPFALKTAMNRSFVLSLAAMFLMGELLCPLAVAAEAVASAEPAAKDMFDAMQDGSVEAKFIARDSHRGRIVLTNKTNQPLSIEIPDAFIGVPMAQMGGMGGGMGGGMMGGMGGGGQQSVGGGGGGGRGGRGGGGRGGGGRGGFNIPPERIVRVDVPLLCLDHGKKEPTSSKPYAIRPIENYIDDPAVIAIVSAYASGDLPTGSAQAAVWHLNSQVGWNELASKLTGTVRSVVRESYFSNTEIREAMAIVQDARRLTADEKVKPREFKLPGEKASEPTSDPSEIVSPGEQLSPANETDGDVEAKGDEPAAAETDAPEDGDEATDEAVENVGEVAIAR